MKIENSIICLIGLFVIVYFSEIYCFDLEFPSKKPLCHTIVNQPEDPPQSTHTTVNYLLYPITASGTISNVTVSTTTTI